jgi:hypothetical protein
VATHDPSALPLGQRTIELADGRVRRSESDQPGPERPAVSAVSTVSTR